jgi:hypothetical protein
MPKSVKTNRANKVTILWNQQVQIDRNLPNNKPDIVIMAKDGGTFMVIDGGLLGYRNVIQIDTE